MGVSMSQLQARTRRLDTERLFLVPVLVLLLMICIGDLWDRWPSDLSEASTSLSVVHKLLRVCFYVLMISLLLTRRPSKASIGSRRAVWAAYVARSPLSCSWPAVRQ